MDDLVTLRDAAREIGVDPSALRHRLKVGTLRGENIAGRVWLIPRSEVDRARREGRLKPGPRRSGTA